MTAADVFRSVATPGIIIHELVHAAAGYAAGARVQIDTSGWGGTTTLTWPLSTPRWKVRVVHLAPTLVGLVALLAAFASLAVVETGGRLASPLGAFTAVYASVQFWLFTYPNEADRRPFQNAS